MTVNPSICITVSYPCFREPFLSDQLLSAIDYYFLCFWIHVCFTHADYEIAIVLDVFALRRIDRFNPRSDGELVYCLSGYSSRIARKAI